MFFSWLRENKQFNRRSNLSGQITPFLIVVLVILLIAAISTINIGRVSIDKTCSGNAADAGSLAAASGYASALNSLAQLNSQLETGFDYGYAGYEAIYEESKQYLEEAIEFALAGSALAAAALTVATDSFINCNMIWFPALAIVALDGAAAALLEQAAEAVNAFIICVGRMKSITESVHESQWKAYCNDVVAMDASYESSYNAAYNYAFSNSCISAKLSDKQNDEFTLWMSSFTTKSGDPSDIKDWLISYPARDGAYNWYDKEITNTIYVKPSQEHTVTANLDLPKITSYELQHTVGSFSDIDGLLDDINTRANIISGVLLSTAVILGTAATMFGLVFTFSVITFIFYNLCKAWWMFCAAYAAFCIITVFDLYPVAMSLQITIVNALAALVAAAGAYSLYELEDKNDEAYDDWHPDGIQSIANCQTCKPCRNDEDKDLETCGPCQLASDLMIVRFDGVTIPRWSAKIWTAQKHPGSDIGIVATKYPDKIEGYSEANFTGGDVGAFNEDAHGNEIYYDAKIVDTK